MFQLTLSPTQLLSHQYLNGLCSLDGLLIKIVEQKTLWANQSLKGSSACEIAMKLERGESSPQLIIFGESLNLEKLIQVEEALESVLIIGALRPMVSSELVGKCCVKADVEIIGLEKVAAKLEETATRLQVELAVIEQTPVLSKPGLLLMDMDSTVIAVECIDEIAKLTGAGDKVSEVTELAMQGKLDFAESLTSRVACLKGVELELLEQVRDALPIMPGISHLVGTLKQHGWKVAIASGGFTFFADYLQQRLGLDAAVANQLQSENGQLTGKVSGAIVDAQTKANTLTSLADKWGIPPEQTVALGDGANDLVMMSAASLGVAYHAKPLVRQKADAAIRFGGTDMLLWMLDD